MADTIIVPWTVAAARTNRSTPLDSGAQPWPNGVNCIQGRIDCTPFSGAAATKFDDPSKIIDWTLSWSLDGGTTWLSNGGAEAGSPTGIWGKASPFPKAELDFSSQPQIPTHYRAQATPRQNLNFGVSMQLVSRTPSLK